MRGRLLLIATTVCLLASRSEAVIKVDTPLERIVGNDFVFVGVVENYYGDKPAMMIAVKESLNGKTPPFKKMPINLKVDDPEKYKNNFIEPLLKRFGPDLEMVFFIKERGDRLITFGFTNGTWFQLDGTPTAKDEARFALVSAEPYFRKTFKGTTAELKKALKDHYTSKAKLPPFDGKAEPGLGEEYKAKQKGERHTERDWLARAFTPTAPGSSFAVIPTAAFIAPLAILAMLFPTVFGGVLVLFRHWVAFITLISINGTLLLLQIFVLPLIVRGTWWNAPSSLWFVMTLVTAACTLWAWRRQLHLFSEGEFDTPPLTELIVLAVMAFGMIGTSLGVWFVAEPSWRNVGWALTVVMTLGVIAGLVYRCWLMVPNDTLFAAPAVASEGVIIGAMLFGQVAFVPLLIANNAGGTTAFNENAAKTTGTIVPVVKKWEFSLTDPGFYCSSPVVHGDVVYAVAALPNVGGTLVCLDRHTGKQAWEFIDRGYLKQGISTPCLADGKLYFGEGFHGDPQCKVYCVDAKTGTKVWDFATKNQTESSPTVADGRLFSGAGNDGLYCFDVKQSIEQKKGVVLWHHPPADYKGRDQRFAAGMRVVGARLYCGTGVHRDPKYADKGETAVFCFDCATGKQLWKTETPYAVWSTPIVKDGRVYVTCGNGDILDDTKDGTPGGALFCLDAETGKQLWRFDTPNGIIESPAVDAHRIYFGCRDSHLYCVSRADGKERWKIFLQSPVIATPVLDMDPVYERTTSVFAVATAGNICCVNPQTGDIVWDHNLAGLSPNITASPRLVVTPTADGYRRQLYIGAGVGGGRDAGAHQAVLYCFEDMVRVD